MSAADHQGFCREIEGNHGQKAVCCHCWAGLSDPASAPVACREGFYDKSDMKGFSDFRKIENH